VLYTAGTAGGNDRDTDRLADMPDQFNVKTAIGTVPINAVEPENS